MCCRHSAGSYLCVSIPSSHLCKTTINHIFILYLEVKVLRAVLGVEVLGWAVALTLGAGCGVLGCLTAGPDTAWVALAGRLLDRGRICITAGRQNT